MTTAQSPLAQLEAQAERIAAMLKAAERGETIDPRYAARIEAARRGPSFSVGIVMDDKVLKIEMPWPIIRETSEAGLAAWIVRQMQEARDTAH